jgi:hypothetical protein
LEEATPHISFPNCLCTEIASFLKGLAFSALFSSAMLSVIRQGHNEEWGEREPFSLLRVSAKVFSSPPATTLALKFI